MKTKMNLCILMVVLFGLSSFAQKTELIYVRIQESISNNMFDSYMQITFADNTSRTIELDKVKMSGNGAVTNGKKIQAELTELLNSGYTVLSSSVGCDINISTTVMLLTRKKEN